MKRQFLSLLGSRVLANLILAAQMIVLARSVLTNEFGLYGILMSVGVYVGIVTDFGLSTYLSRERALKNDYAVSSGLRINMIGSLVGASILVVVACVLASNLITRAALIVVGIAMAIEKNTDTALSIPIADGVKAVPAISVILRRTVSFAVFIALFALGLEVLVAFGFGNLIGAVVGQLHIRYKYLRSNVQPLDRGSFSFSLLHNSLPFMVVSLTSQIRQLDVVVVGSVTGASGAGLYSAAAKLLSPFLMIPAAFSSLVVPNAARQPKDRMCGIAIRISCVFVSCLVPLALVAYLGKWGLPLLLGATYTDSVPVFQVLLLAAPFIALSPPLEGILQAHGRERFVAVNGVIFAVITAGSLVALTHGFGAIGAALAIGATYLSRCVVLLLGIYAFFGHRRATRERDQGHEQVKDERRPLWP